MAKVFGSAGKHAGRQSVEAFKRMFRVVFILGIVVAFCEGVILTASVTNHIRGWWLVLPIAVGILLWSFADYANRHVDKHETDRMSWRKGAVGEYEVGAELERLSDKYSVFNDVNTEEFGNFDHIVVGPSGIFALETKNWTGLIAADAAGELTRNGKPSSQPHVHNLERKLMMLREQILVLCRQNDLFVRGVMVFPKASVAAPFNNTKRVHCMRLEQLRDYIDNPKFSQNLGKDRVGELVRALHGVAAMDEQFGMAN